jgi:hypothetical protein
MNIVLLINSYNLEDIRSFVTAAAELQEEKADGAFLVIYQKTLGQESIEELVAPLAAKMSAAGTMPVPINEMLTNDGRTSSLFCYFLSQGYVRFPGPWLIVDGPGVPTKKNFIHILERQHGGLGGTCSGRFSADGIAQVPVGPLVLGVPVSSLTWFNGGYESWRATMRFMFHQQGFKVVPLDEYLFSLPSAFNAPLESIETLPQAAEPAGPPASPSPSPVAATQPEDAPPDVSPSEDSVCPGTDIVCPEEPEPESEPVVELGKYEGLDREALFILIAARPHLDKPHHSSGIAKLLGILVQDDEAPNEA